MQAPMPSRATDRGLPGSGLNKVCLPTRGKRDDNTDPKPTQPYQIKETEIPI